MPIFSWPNFSSPFSIANFSFDEVDLYINWTNHSLFIILGKLSALNLICSNVILVSNCHGSKEEAINLIPHYLIDNIHKTVKPSHLQNLQTIQNINKLMFQVNFIFSN